MRRLAAAAALALALYPVAAAGAHPGHGAEAVTVDGDAFRFSPGSATIGVGDTVIWYWEGSVFRNHSVTSDPGQAEQFDSDPSGPPSNDSHPFGSEFSHAFGIQGRFTYYCKNHPTMRGVVEVVPVPDASAGAPRLSRLRVLPAEICAQRKAGCRDKRPHARFRLSERAEVVARIAERRRGRWRTVESFYRQAESGTNRMGVPVRGLAPGRYRLAVVAYDAADQRSNVARARFALRR